MNTTPSAASSGAATWMGKIRPTGNLLRERFRVPDPWVRFVCDAENPKRPGYFSFGDDLICFGRCPEVSVAGTPNSALPDALSHARIGERSVELPFHLDDVVRNYLHERYTSANSNNLLNRAVRSAYYAARPMLGVGVRKYLQRIYLNKRQTISFPRWPVDVSVDRLLERSLGLGIRASGVQSVPFIWFWPEGYQSACIVTHDVEQGAGRDFCPTLMDMDDASGIKSSFQVVPELRYDVPDAFLAKIRDRGFEVCVHDLNHDGRLFSDEKTFRRRVEAINRYGRQWQAAGFRAGIMYRNQEWFGALDFEYDMSVPSAAHLEPQRGGCCTILPYFVGDLVELPLTTSQDYTLFHILGERNLELWKREIDTVHSRHGLITVLTHPDYLTEPWAQEIYRGLLEHIAEKAARENIWLARPREVSRWWKARRKLSLVSKDGSWKIEGEGCERARVCYATLEGDNLRYSFQAPATPAHQMQQRS